MISLQYYVENEEKPINGDTMNRLKIINIKKIILIFCTTVNKYET